MLNHMRDAARVGQALAAAIDTNNCWGVSSMQRMCTGMLAVHWGLTPHGYKEEWEWTDYSAKYIRPGTLQELADEMQQYIDADLQSAWD